MLQGLWVKALPVPVLTVCSCVLLLQFRCFEKLFDSKAQQTCLPSKLAQQENYWWEPRFKDTL